MPGGNGTGPMGMGPMTGRAAGFCAGFGVPGYANPVAGRGRAFGRGRGFGHGRCFGWAGRGYAGGAMPFGSPYAPMPAPVPPSPEQEMSALRAQAEYLDSALAEIRARLAELDAARDEGGK